MPILRGRLTWVWLGLMTLTVLTTWFLSKELVSPAAAVCGIVGIAALKVRFIMLDFMELREAPTAVRIAFEGWIVVVTAIILGFWFLTTGIGR